MIDAPARPRVAMLQDAARLHYAIPLAMQRFGVLERMYTDLFITRRSPMRAAIKMLKWAKPGLARQLAGRRCDELDPRRVRSNPWITLRYHKRFPSPPIPASFWIWSCQQIGDWVMRQGFGKANALMGFVNSIDPRLLRHAKEQGLSTIGDQMIAPIATELAEAESQVRRWPGWEPSYSLDELSKLEPFQFETWEALDHFSCASEYVKQGLISEGISSDRVTVIPYPINSREMAFVDRSKRDGILTVGFVGAVSLRKGA